MSKVKPIPEHVHKPTMSELLKHIERIIRELSEQYTSYTPGCVNIKSALFLYLADAVQEIANRVSEIDQ